MLSKDMLCFYSGSLWTLRDCDLTSDTIWHWGRGYETIFFPVRYHSRFSELPNTGCLYDIVFIFWMCCHRWVAQTSGKYERAIKDLIYTFAQPKFTVLELQLKCASALCQYWLMKWLDVIHTKPLNTSEDTRHRLLWHWRSYPCTYLGVSTNSVGIYYHIYSKNWTFD